MMGFYYQVLVWYRYMAFPENKMNVGLDFAAGKDDWGIYFRIGESFK